MKGKLSVLAVLVCCISLFIGCNNNQKKVKNTVEVPQAIQKILSQKYPDATILEFDKEKAVRKSIYKTRAFARKSCSILTTNGYIPNGISVRKMFRLS